MDARAPLFARMEGDRKLHDDYEGINDMSDVDFGFTLNESGRGVFEPSDDDDTLDGLDFTALSPGHGRPLDTADGTGRADSTRSAMLDGQSTSGFSKDRSFSLDSQSSNITSQSPERKQQSFQPLLPLPEHPTIQRSAPRAIPKAPQSHNQPVMSTHPSSQPSSAGSTASAFLNNLLDPAATTFNNTHMSHTPPNHIATSYEASHFGKRARSGSVSERLKVSTELEQKGMIDREQKGILKDLIISGQDNELQHALDLYEQGDAALLEAMLQSGTLSNRARNEIDLLGDLDLDFLNVNDDSGIAEMTSQNIAYEGSTNNHDSHSMHPQSSHSAQGQSHAMGESAQREHYEASDGIGELDFDGGMGGSENFGSNNVNFRMPSPMYHPGQRSRSNSTFSVDLDYRQRSNSLFSALIGSVTPNGGTPVEYGRWMEGQDAPEEQDVARNGILIGKPTRRASAPEALSNLSITMAKEEHKLSAAQRKELKAEEKRRERQEKKEEKERQKREKKEKREQAKLDKHKRTDKDDADDEEEDGDEAKQEHEHEPGSGRPRSLSDPNIRSSIDVDGLLQVERPDGWIGAYSPESRKVRITRFLEKRNHRVWTKTVKYDVRKNFADSRLRVKGRFVKKEDELLMRELMSLT